MRSGFALVLLALLLGGCGTSAPATSPVDGGAVVDLDAAVKQIAMPTGDPLSWPVDKRGPFNVGHRSYETSYTPPGQTAPRTIPIEIWYPSLDAEGETAKYLMLFGDPDTFEGASVAPPISATGYPVHVYSHGSSGFPGTSHVMAHDFASHGWVYVAPSHVGNTLGSPEGKDRPLAIYYERATDVRAAIDFVEKTPPADFKGKLRTERVLLSGHSFGGYTSWIVGGAPFAPMIAKMQCDAGAFSAPCKPQEIAAFDGDYHDSRVVAVIPMAGGDFEWIGDVDAPKKPFLVMTGSEDVSAQPAWDKSASLDFTWIEFTGGCHQLFALGSCPKFEEKLGWQLTNTWALAFARRHILGDASTEKIVTGVQSISDRIVFKHKGGTTPPSGS